MYKRGTCWEGYVQAGMKKKGNKMVPNCVPKGTKKMKEGGLTDDMIRLSVGLEDINDITKDFERGFKAVKKLNK